MTGRANSGLFFCHKKSIPGLTALIPAFAVALAAALVIGSPGSGFSRFPNGVVSPRQDQDKADKICAEVSRADAAALLKLEKNFAREYPDNESEFQTARQKFDEADARLETILEKIDDRLDLSIADTKAELARYEKQVEDAKAGVQAGTRPISELEVAKLNMESTQYILESLERLQKIPSSKHEDKAARVGLVNEFEQGTAAWKKAYEMLQIEQAYRTDRTHIQDCIAEKRRELGLDDSGEEDLPAVSTYSGLFRFICEARGETLEQELTLTLELTSQGILTIDFALDKVKTQVDLNGYFETNWHKLDRWDSISFSGVVLRSPQDRSVLVPVSFQGDWKIYDPETKKTATCRITFK